MNASEVNALVATWSAGHDALLHLIGRARTIFRLIQRFNLVAHDDLARIAKYRSAYLGEPDIDALPAEAIFAGEHFDRADVNEAGVSIVSNSYRGNNEYEHHHFTLPFEWLSWADADIEAHLRARVVFYLKEVDEHERKQDEKATAEQRAEYERLKEIFDPRLTGAGD